MSVFLFDKSESLIKTLPPSDVFESIQVAELGGLIKHDITIKYSKDIADAVFFGMHDVDNANSFLMYKIIRSETFNGRIRLHGLHVFFDDLKAGGIVRDIRPNNQTAGNALSQILSDSRWQVSTSSATSVASSSFYYLTHLEAFWKLLKTWNVEFGISMSFHQGKITGRYINLYDTYAPDYGKWYETGDKLLTLVAEEDRTNVFTAFLGRGKGEAVGEGYGRKITFADVEWSIANGDPLDKPLGQDYLEIPWATALYGYSDGTPRYTSVDYGDIEDPEKLLRQTYQDALLNCIPKRQFSTTVHTDDLTELGEIVSIIADDIGVRYQTRIFKITRDFLNPKKKEIEFGHKVIRTSAERAQLQTETTEQLIADQESKLSIIRQEIKDSYWNEDGYNYELKTDNEYGLPAGYYSFDAPIDQDPTKVIYVGAGKMLIADSKDGSGEWDWRTAATGSGFVGDVLVAHSVTANKLAADVGQSLDLSSNVSVTSRVTSADMASYVSDATSNLASTSYVDGAIDAINRANPNLISNRSDRWEQGNIVGGALTASANHIRSQSYFPVRAGAVTMKVSPLYEVALVNYDQNYSYISTSSFATEQTINIPTNSLFKAVLRRVGGTDDILPAAIDTAELKIENATEATQWTPYFGDLSPEGQKEFFSLHLSSSNGWTMGDPTFTTTLTATLFLFNEDVSTTYPGANIFWYRQYEGEPKALIGSGLTYNVTTAEAQKSATYEVEFFIPANKHYITTKSGDHILTKGGDKILAKVSDDPGVSVTESKVLVRDYRDRIIAAESSVTQLADSIEQKVEVSTYNAEKNVIETNITTLTTRATNVEAAINGATHTFTATGYVFKDANGNVVMDNSLGMANEQNLMKHDDCESGFPLVMPIHIGSSTSSIYQVLVKWKNSPFRATAKSASAGGATTSGASSTTTTASGGSHTATSEYAGSATRTTYSLINANASTSGTPSTTTFTNHRPSVTPGLHAHNLDIPSHRHSVAISSHSHNMAHTHDISAHTHDLIFGVVETPVTSNALTVWIDGVQRGSVNSAQGELDVTSFLQTTGWHTIELRTTTLKRIDGNVFVKSYIRR